MTSFRARPRLSLVVGAMLLVALVVLVVSRIAFLHGETLRRWRASLEGGAVTTQATVDGWYGERVGDAEMLAASVALLDRVAGAPAANEPRPVERLLAPTLRRQNSLGGWVLDANDRVIAGTNGLTIFPAEIVAAREARLRRRSVRSAIVTGPVSSSIAIASPVPPGPHVRGSGDPVTIVLRSDVVAAFTPWVTGRPNAAMSLFSTPSPDGAVTVAACPGHSPPVCVTHHGELKRGSAADLSLSRVDTFGVFPAVEGGEPVLAVTRYDSTLGWGIVRRVKRSDAFVPFWKALALEGLFLLVVLALLAMFVDARERRLRVRRMREQAHADQRLATIVDAATDGLLSFDDGLVITMSNAAVDRMLGYPRGALVGRELLELFSPEWRGYLRRSLADFMRATTTGVSLADTEWCQALRLDGTFLAVDARLGRAELDGVALYTMGLHDVSERARTESFLSRQRHILEQIASGSPTSESLCTLFDLMESEAPQMRFAAYELSHDGIVAHIVCAPHLPAGFVEVTDEIVVGPVSAAVGTAIFRDEPVYSTDIATDPLWETSREYILAHGVRGAWAIPLHAADGRSIGALACYYSEARGPSMRELELASAAVHLASIALYTSRDAASLRASEASFRSFVENAPAAIFRETRYGRLVSANPAMLTLLGYDSVDALQEAAERKSLYHDLAARARMLAELESHDVVRGQEVEWCRADGSLVTVRVSARAYRDDRGEIWLWEGYAEDVTLLRAAEQALRRNERLAAVGQLVSGVAHELNNPLSSILHFAEDLLTDERSREDAEALGVICDQARRSRAIVRDLLSFVRQRATNAEPLALAEVVAGTLRMMRSTAELGGARLHADLDDERATVVADRGGVEQVVTNLVSNAVQAAGAGGDVWIRVAGAGSDVRLIVEDSGPGIPADVRPHIFDPFFTTKPTGEGTGLGLSVTLGLVEQMGGRITVEPRLNGALGSCFVVTLPRVDAADMKRATATASPMVEPSLAALLPTVRKRHALVIDDEPTIRAALCRFFTRRGWTVDEACDGAAGLALLDARGDEFDVVISDLRMPGVSGVELHDRLALEHPSILERMIFSTGDVASSEAASFVRRTTCLVLQKPFELRMLDEVIALVDARIEASRRSA
ncbi:MAG: PAS domain S-box protein [Gemmatimonadaceae bacterium]|nr:PAS domain S-box protein [Gemmatimonadaceae bacterium]